MAMEQTEAKPESYTFFETPRTRGAEPEGSSCPVMRMTSGAKAPPKLSVICGNKD